MAGDFRPQALNSGNKAFGEFNIVQDVSSSRYFLSNCPCPIVFSGWEIGSRILYPCSSILNDFNWADRHPMVEAYKIFKPMPYDRPTWDLTAVLEAVFPGRYFGYSKKGTVTLNHEGVVQFSAHQEGKHQYLLLEEEDIPEIRDLFIKLCSQPLNSHVKV